MYVYVGPSIVMGRQLIIIIIFPLFHLKEMKIMKRRKNAK